MSGQPNQTRQFETKRVIGNYPWTVRSFAVVGEDADETSHFVAHAALNEDTCEIREGAVIPVFHMCPPLAGPSIEGSQSNAIRADVVSDISLDVDELNSMKHWRANVEKLKRDVINVQGLRPFREYILFPHKKPVLSELNRPIYWRYSCAGLVIDCYETAGIEIIDLSAEMPEIDEECLAESYPRIARLEEIFQKKQDHEFLSKYGYRGLADLGLAEKPWRPIFVGYLFHSLKRFSVDTTRPKAYSPKSSLERYFPLPPAANS